MNYMWFDGGSSGNPGKAACAFIITDDKYSILYTRSIFLGDNITNNVAEYCGVLYGLISALAGGIKEITVYGDSELVIKQLNGEYQVKSINLINYYTQVKHIIQHFTIVKYAHNGRSNHPLQIQCDQACNLLLYGSVDKTK